MEERARSRGIGRDDTICCNLQGSSPRICFDEITLTICCRYAESLLKNLRVNKYLSRQHPDELRGLQELLAEFERACWVEDGPGLIRRIYKSSGQIEHLDEPIALRTSCHS